MSPLGLRRLASPRCYHVCLQSSAICLGQRKQERIATRLKGLAHFHTHGLDERSSPLPFQLNMRTIDNHIVLLLIIKWDDPACIKIQAKQKRRRFLPLYRREQGRPNRIKYTCCTNRNVTHSTSYITNYILKLHISSIFDDE